MIRGLYEAAAGMRVRTALQDITANNLANAGTTGFQREIAGVQAQRVSGGSSGPTPAARTELPLQLLHAFSSPDTRSGQLRQTGAPADVALEGPGYLVARTARGPRLFRGGTLQANSRGELVTASGDPLLGTDGNPIRVGGSRWGIQPDGTVTAAGAAGGRLRVAVPAGPARREGNSLLAAAGLRDVPAGSTRVLQGFLEHSNVEPVREMVDMIAGVRAYEASQRAVTAQDETLQRLFTLLQR